MPGELAAMFRALADDTGEAAGSMATAISRFAVATADTEDANVARTLAADADTAQAIVAIRGGTGGWAGAGYVGESSREEEAAFAAIRAKTGDVARIAANTGINEEVLTQAKTHLFMTTHDVPIAAGRIVHGYFTADGETAAQWARAENGTLNRAQAIRFRGLMAHEYVESRLMESGMPYRSEHPAAWIGDYQDFNTEHFGAHDVAPKSADGSLELWGDLGLTPPDEPIAPDLSNLDNVVEAARRGLDL